MAKDQRPCRPEQLTEHESGVRRMMADAAGQPYEALHSLAEAQALSDGVVVLEGDFGGQIYVVVIAAQVHCSEHILQQLLRDIDDRHWADPDGARVYYERHEVGEGIGGGMGGGVVSGSIWVHPKLNVPREVIADVLGGSRERIEGEAG